MPSSSLTLGISHHRPLGSFPWNLLRNIWDLYSAGSPSYLQSVSPSLSNTGLLGTGISYKLSSGSISQNFLLLISLQFVLVNIALSLLYSLKGSC